MPYFVNYLRFNLKWLWSGFSNSLQLLLKMRYCILIVESNYYKLLIYWITVPDPKSKLSYLSLACYIHTKQNQTYTVRFALIAKQVHCHEILISDQIILKFLYGVEEYKQRLNMFWTCLFKDAVYMNFELCFIIANYKNDIFRSLFMFHVFSQPIDRYNWLNHAQTFL